MSLNLNKRAWKRVRLGEVIRRSRIQVDPFSSGVKRYVGGGHIDSEGVTIERWGHVDDGQMGSTFRYVFKPGQVLFVSARPYLRKVGIADFSGVVADKTYVLDAVRENGLLQEFLPFVLSSEAFVEYATAEATGSMNPRLLWGPMQRYQFDLPPLNEQKRLADLLWAIEDEARAEASVAEAALDARSRLVNQFFSAHSITSRPISEVVESLRDGPFGSKIKSEHYAEVGVRVLRLQDVQKGVIVDTDVAYLDQMHVSDNLGSYRVDAGDVVVAGLGDESHPVGRAALADPAQGAVHKADIFRARVRDDLVRPSYFVEALNASYSRPLIMAQSQGTTRLRINTSNLKKVKLPFPSLLEQDKLLVALSRFDATTADALRSIKAVSAIRSATSVAVFRSAE